MVTVKDVVRSYLDAIGPSTITIKKFGKAGKVHLATASCSVQFVATDRKRMRQLEDGLRQILSLKNTPT
jgi:hypothetical protein